MEVLTYYALKLNAQDNRQFELHICNKPQLVPSVKPELVWSRIKVVMCRRPRKLSLFISCNSDAVTLIPVTPKSIVLQTWHQSCILYNVWMCGAPYSFQYLFAIHNTSMICIWIKSIIAKTHLSLVEIQVIKYIYITQSITIIQPVKEVRWISSRYKNRKKV